MPGHTRFSRFVTRARSIRKEKQFVPIEEVKLKEEEGRILALSEKRMEKESRMPVRKTMGVSSTARRAFAGFQDFATGFARRQEPRRATVTQTVRPVRRRRPTMAPRRRVLFDQFGRQVVVSNGQPVRRTRRRRRRVVQAQPRSAFQPSGLV